MREALKQLRIVLVGPRDSRNIGAVCRAMKTMGITSLYIVGSKPIDLQESAILAIHAEDVLDKAVRCSSLDEALRDASLVAGVTRRRGRWRKYFALTPEELAEKVAALQGICALVFGNEASGLSDRELSSCHLAVRIPSSPLFPSLNLSHAVQVICYAMFRAFSVRKPSNRFHPIDNTRLDELVSVILGSLKNIGFFTQTSQEDLGIFWRDILARAALSAGEARRLETVFRKISGLITKKGISS